jgi:hypothetical protein
MNNFMYAVLSAGIHVIYTGEIALILVICVIGHSVKSSVLKNINVYIVVNALMLVMCVTRHSVNAAIL